MADYEHSRSESGYSTRYRVGPSLPEKPPSFVDSIVLGNEVKKIQEENRQRNEAEYGRDLDAYTKGRDARLAGFPLDLSKCNSEDSRRSYYKGYEYGGNRQLKMTAQNRMTEMVTLIYYGFGDKDYNPEKYGFPTRKEFASSKTPEYLYVIGYCDATHGIIDFDKLPDEIKANTNYMQGYNDAKELIDASKKAR